MISTGCNLPEGALHEGGALPFSPSESSTGDEPRTGIFSLLRQGEAGR
jgi:hypothetical protein